MARIAVIALLVGLLPVSPVAAGPVADPIPTRAAAPVAALRTAASTGSLAGLLGTLTEVPPPPPSSEDPLQALVSAFRWAQGEVLAATRRLTPAAAKAGLRALARPRSARTIRPGDSLSVPSRSLPAAAERASALVEGARIRAAALRLAVAIDRALPVLERAGGRAPIAGRAGAGCDLVDTDVLCMSGPGDDLHERIVPLSIDLGGDDTYTNLAGGGSVLRAMPMPVGVAIDLGGDDTYDHVTTAGGESEPAQGSGIAGIGILVDVGGDDAYRVSIRVPGGAARSVTARVDGQGEGALGGVGVLADLGGRDTYTLDASGARPSDLGEAYGQAVGAVGTGLLLDAGHADDRYTMRGGTAGIASATPLVGAYRSVQGQGLAALGGAAALIDGGGSDQLSMEARTEGLPEVSSYLRYEFEQAPGAALYGQGNGAFGGAAFLLTGDGPTSYSVSAHGSGLGAHSIQAQAIGSVGALGVLDDLGGDDAYTMESSMEATAELAEPIVDPGCECQRVDLDLNGLRTLTTQDVAGQAHGHLYGGVGLLADHAGNDRYRAISSSHMRGSATSSDRSIPAAARLTSFAAGPLYAQATAISYAHGVLIDSAGDDLYEVSLTTRTDATAAAPDGGEATADAKATWLQPSYIAGQGAGTRVFDEPTLLDRDGRDTYIAIARTNASAAPDPAGAHEEGGMALFQGSGSNGALVDEGDVGGNRFVSEPNFEDTCTGVRGQRPYWVECRDPSPRPDLPYVDPPTGHGTVNTGLPKAESSLALDQASFAGSDGDTIVVTGRASLAGAPMPHLLVEVRLQYYTESGVGTISPPLFHSWMSASAMHAVTDQEGRFRALLRVPAISGLPPGTPLRIFAMHSGTVTIRGASDVRTFSPA